MGQGVVRGRNSRQGVTRNLHYLTGAGIGISKERCRHRGRVDIHHVASHLAAERRRATDCGLPSAVIHLVRGRQAGGHRQRLRGDIDRDASCRRESVVGAITPRQTQTGERNRLVDARIRIRDRSGCRAAQLHIIRTDHAAERAARQNDACRSVVHLVR